jgi:phosphotransferase system enzyme I (PtsP)
LAALGYRNLSMSASALGPVKAMVRGLDLGAVTKQVLPLVAEPGELDSLRETLRKLATDIDIPL